MILEEDAILRTRITGALAPEGVDVLSFGRLGPAKEAARRANVDILVLGETIDGRLASDVALLAEWRNPRLGSILLSDRDAEAAEELFDLIPSLQAVLARGTGARTLARVAIATARSQEGIVLVQDDWRSGDAGPPLGGEDWVLHGSPIAEAPVPEPSFAPVHDAPEPAWAMPTAEEEEPVRTMPALAEAARDPFRAILATAEDVEEPAWVMSVPVEEAPATVAPQPAPLQGALAPLRDRLIQAQERLAALEGTAPVQELPVRRPEEASPGLLFALPSFLRDAEDFSPSGNDPATPHPAMLPVQAAAPRRRLHLA